MAKPTHRFDRDILRDEKAYWETFSLEEIAPRIENAKSGYEIYQLMSFTKGVTTKDVYGHFGLTPEEVDVAEKDGWTGGCFALGAKLGKPRRSETEPIPTTQEQLDADPAWPGIQENRLVSLLKAGHRFAPEALSELREIFPEERVARVLQKLPPESQEKLAEAIKAAGEPLPEVPHVGVSVPAPPSLAAKEGHQH